MLRVMNLLEEPQSGFVRVFGVEYGPSCPSGATRGSPLQLRRMVGMVFQEFTCSHT